VFLSEFTDGNNPTFPFPITLSPLTSDFFVNPSTKSYKKAL